MSSYKPAVMSTGSTRTMDPEDYRAVMANWVTGVGLITSLGINGPAGCTANSLTSLSLDPPLLLVCFKKTARTLVAVRETNAFGINILSWDQRVLSTRFASSDSHEDKFREIAWRVIGGVPIVDDCLAHIICGVEREVDVGDHVIVVGRPLESTVDHESSPVAFFRRSYHRTVEHVGSARDRR